MASVFMLVILAWVPFRWGVPVAFDFWNSMLRGSDFSIGYSRIFWALPILLGPLFIDYLQYHTQDEFVYLKWPRWVRAVCMAMIMMLVFLVTGGDFKEPFVYQAF
jgi:hypothetical protein